MQAIFRHGDRHRLPGEPAESTLGDEIEHWRLVYEELLTTIDELLERQSASAARCPDVSMLQARRRDLAGRLEHWRNQEPGSSDS